jgi:hypothetical protein
MSGFVLAPTYGSTFDVLIEGASCKLTPRLPAYVHAGKYPRIIDVTITIEEDFTLSHQFGEHVNVPVGEARIAPLLQALGGYVARNQATVTDRAKLMAGYWNQRFVNRLAQQEKKEKKGKK